MVFVVLMEGLTSSNDNTNGSRHVEHNNQVSIANLERCIEAARPSHEIIWRNDKNEGFI